MQLSFIRTSANKFDLLMQMQLQREREREPLLPAATQCVTELFKFIEKVPPLSAIILCKDSRECDGGTLAKSTHVKVNYIALSTSRKIMRKEG